MFLVTGYPRSGTAWVANFLTASGRFCWHEYISIHKCSPHDVYQRLGSDGDSCNLHLMLNPPDVPLVVIHRDKDESWDAYTRELQRVPLEIDLDELDILYLRMESGLSTLETRRNALNIDFAELFDEKSVKAICDHVGAIFSLKHFNAMRRLKVTQNIKEFI